MAALRVTTASFSRLALTSCRPHVYLGVRAGLRQVLATSKTYSYSYSTAPAQTLAPKIERGGSKLYKDADEAVKDIKSGSTILSSGFGLCGVAGEFQDRRVG